MGIIDQKIYTDAWQRYKSTYQLSDQILYDLFARYTDYQDTRQVLIKVQFIDALYSTRLYQRVGIVDVVRCLCLPLAQSVSEELGNYKLASNVSSLDPAEILSDIAEFHQRLVDHLHQRIGSNESVFVSKYMHFHRGDIVPILDSMAEDTITKKHIFDEHTRSRTTWSKETRYQKFCRYFGHLWRDALTFDTDQVTIVKKIDQYLYQYERTPEYLARNYF